MPGIGVVPALTHMAQKIVTTGAKKIRTGTHPDGARIGRACQRPEYTIWQLSK